jgi:5-methylcytosine-specific restriction endonuclease McrA
MCQYCGSELDYWEVDHIKPIEDLGSDDLSNLAAACHGCNRAKSDRPKEEVRKEIYKRRSEILLKRLDDLFLTRKGRSLIKKFLFEDCSE